jgi:hypothetical protein
MQHIKQLKWSILIALIISGGMIGGAAAFAQSDTQSEHVQADAGITFPIPELGGCTDKASCKTYCDASDHMTECVAFAEMHGLMDKEEGARAKKFASRVKAGEGPGGCASPGMCKTYCEDIAHVDECVAFAEKNNFKGQSYEHGKKVGIFLKSGGKMPGGCTSRASCEEYCSNFSHAQECFAFAQKAGIDQPANSQEDHKKTGEPQDVPTSEQMQKLQALAEAGETPGGCKTKDECMQYCRGDGHRDECILFAEKAGFMNKTEAAHAKKFNGGPGGCNSQESCHAFCNDPVNREVCFAFAKENALIPESELKQMQEGWVRMREGITNAPVEVQSCLKTMLGENVIDDIQSGKLVPGPDIGERMRGCFEKFGGHHDPKKVFNEAPPQVTACLKEKLGADFESIRSGKTPPTPETADSFRMCFQQMEMSRGGSGAGTEGKQGGLPDAEKFKMYLRSAPPEVSACLKEKLGDQFEKLLLGEIAPTPELGQTMRTCFEQFRPQMNQGGSEGGVPGKMMGVPPMQGGSMMERMPPQVAACLKEKLGEEKFTQLQSGRPTPEIEQSMRTCFQQFSESKGILPQGVPQNETRTPLNADMLNHLSPEIQACLKEKLGAEKFAQLGSGGVTADLKMVMTACFEKFGKPMGIPTPPQGSLLQGSDGMNWLSRLPPTVQACLKAKVGDEVFTKIGETLPTPALTETIKGCFVQSGAFPTMDGTTSMPPPLGSDGQQAIPPPSTVLPPMDGGSQPPTGM